MKVMPVCAARAEKTKVCILNLAKGKMTSLWRALEVVLLLWWTEIAWGWLICVPACLICITANR